MRRLAILAFASLASLSFAACGGDPDPAEPGDDDDVTTRVFHGCDTETEMLLRSTPNADGSTSLHSEITADLSASFGGTTRLEAIEDAVIGADGRLVSGDLRHRVTYPAKVIDHRVVLDRDAGTVVVTRPNGRVELEAERDTAWVPFSARAGTLLTYAVPSPLTCAVASAAAASSAPLTIVDGTASLIQTFDPHGSVAASEPVGFGDVECAFDDDGGVTGISSPTWGRFDFDDVVDPAPLVDALDVADTSPTIRPQLCTAPTRFETFVVDSDTGHQIHGQIDLPAGDGPFAVVVLNAGSGGGDREASNGGAPQWTCLSHELVAAGIAVVRFDDAGLGQSPGNAAEMTYEGRDHDAIAVARFAAAHELVDADAVFALGHSEGGDRVARVAMAVEDVDGIVMVAGVSSTGAELLVENSAVLFENAGYPAALLDSIHAAKQAWVDSIRDGTAPDTALAPFSRAYWEQFMEFDGAADAVAAARPTLVIQGGSDCQVLAEQADGFEAALTAASIEVEVARFADLGHFQIHNADGFEGLAEEYGLPVGFDPRVTAAIVEWVHGHAP